MVQPAALYYIETDHLDTPRQLTDSTGKVVWQWNSTDAFGANLPNEDADGDGIKVTFNLRMPGQYADKETGSFYNYYRDYDPTTGRYIQSDPIGLGGGLNRYTYVEGNPVSWVDPEGLVKNCGDCAKAAAKIADKKKKCEAELNACKTTVDEIQFFEKYNGTGIASALFNCKSEGDPGVLIKLVWGCWRCTR